MLSMFLFHPRSVQSHIPQTVCPHRRVLTVGTTRPRLDQRTLSGPRFSPALDGKLSQKSSLVKCPCAFRLRRLVQSAWLAMLCSEGLIFTSAPGLFFELCPFFVAGVVFCRIGHFFIRVAWHFLHIAKTLAGAGQNEVVLEFIFSWLAQYLNLDDVLSRSKSSFVKLSSFFGHDDDSVLQVQHFGCLGRIFRGARNTL